MKTILNFSSVQLLIAIFSIFLLFSCAKERLDDHGHDHELQNVDLRGQKVDVCHNGKIINISINAVTAHQNHGDAVDMDGDGYFDMASDCGTGEADCNDNDAAINPGATEVADGVDNNCDGNIDEGLCSPGYLLFTNGNDIIVADDGEVGLYTWQGAIDRCAAKAIEEGCDWYLPSKLTLQGICDDAHDFGGPGIPFDAEAWASDDIGTKGGVIEFNDSDCDGRSYPKTWELNCLCVRSAD